MKKLRFIACVSIAVSVLLGATPQLQAQGHWEFSGHYGKWSLSILPDIVVNEVGDIASDVIRDSIIENIQAAHPESWVDSYEPMIDFQTKGDVFGISIRWYPAGQRGSFSLGISVEKSTFKFVQSSFETQLGIWDEAVFEAGTFTGSGETDAVIKALSFHLSFRWDLFRRWIVHPYFSFGFGASTAKVFDDSTLSYQYSGELVVPDNYTEIYSDSNTKTLRELKDQEYIELPIGFLPFLELSLGLKARITKNIHVLVDAGVFNGFLLRGGLAVRL